MDDTVTIEHRLDRLRRRALLAGGAGLAVCLAGALAGWFASGLLRIVLGAYLIGFLYVLGLTLGCLVLLMLQHLTGGAWGRAIRRGLEAGARTLPAVAVFFVPVLLGVKVLYEWSHAEAVAGDELLRHKALYLNVPSFAIRAVVYFAVWGLLAFLLNRWAREQDRASTPSLARRFRLLSGPGLVLYGLMMTFAAVDWAMSLTPHWFSTIYGVLFMVGQTAAGLSFAIAVGLLIARWRVPQVEIPQQTLADLGSLMLAFVMLWAYIGLSQFLIVWSGNLPEEIPWYLARMHGGWGGLGLSLVIFHFFVPFALLLAARVKRCPHMLARLAGLVLVMRAVDLIWIVAPSFSSPGRYDGFWVALLTPVAVVGIGGVWLSLFVGQLRSRSLSPYPEPETPEMEGPRTHMEVIP